MRFNAFDLNEPLPELREPHAVAMLRPWIDVGSVGSQVLKWMEIHSLARPLTHLATPGKYFDFTRYRPSIYWSEGRRKMVIPNSYITFGKRESGHDFVFMNLLEPHAFGEEYSESLLDVMVRLGVKRYILIGGMYDYVPHTRPLLVTGQGTSEQAQAVLSGVNITHSDYEGPTTICYMVTQGAAERGIECMNMIVHFPQYVSFEEDYIGAARLMNVMSQLYGFPDDPAVAERAREQLAELDLMVSNNEQLQGIIGQLEERYDVQVKPMDERNSAGLSPDVERFLKEMERRFRQG